MRPLSAYLTHVERITLLYNYLQKICIYYVYFIIISSINYKNILTFTDIYALYLNNYIFGEYHSTMVTFIGY